MGADGDTAGEVATVETEEEANAENGRAQEEEKEDEGRQEGRKVPLKAKPGFIIISFIKHQFVNHHSSSSQCV